MSLTDGFARLAALLLLGGSASCNGPADPLVACPEPSGDNFAAVSLVLEANCGTLDCHGAPARNFRVYGQYGLRLFGSDVVGGAGTRDEEVQATYQSIASLEPETLSRVFASGGAGVDGWIPVAKARGLERHKGGLRLPAGSPGDTCLVSWASGALDTSSCLSDGFGPIPRTGETW